MGRAKHSKGKKRRSLMTQDGAMPPSNAQFSMHGGKIESGFFSGPHLPSFWLWANPPDPDPVFAPFYRRAVSGDLGALVEFYCAHGLNPGAAFYQCVGFLAACGSAEETNKTVQKIISINRRGGPQGSGFGKNVLVREWERRLLRPAQSAALWISRNRAESHPLSNRERLWQEYADLYLHPTTPGIRQHLESGIDGLDGTQPIYRISDSAHSSRKELRALVLTQDEIRARRRSIRNHITEVGLAHGIIPKELFCELARTAPTPLSPSVAVRRFARKLVF
jgi:hypothetical protein